jgi:TRAP transporter TAXI family solute receptor
MHTVAGVVAASPFMLRTGSAWAQPKIVQVLTAPLGAGPFEGHTIFANQLARGGEKLIVAAQETPGYVANMRFMAQEKYWKSTVNLNEDVSMQFAFHGGTPEIKEFFPEKIAIKFKILYGESIWTQGKFFVTLNPDIKTMADLKGKRISIGLRSQTDWGMFSKIFLAAHGITPENSDIRHMTPGALTQQLLDGVTDVGISGYGAEPTGKVKGLIAPNLRTLEASGKKIRYIGIDKGVVEKINKKFGTTFLTMTLKAGTLPQQDKDLLVGANRGYKLVHPTFDPELAYEFTRLSIKYQKQMAPLNALWSILTPEMMVEGLTEENTHPGALKALKEAGLWDHPHRTKSVPVTYPG